MHCFACFDMETTEEAVEGRIPTNQQENNNENNEFEQNEQSTHT